MQLPPKGANFKKNNSYDFFVLIPRAIPARSGWYAVTLPRAATPGNTSLCVSYANGTCFGSGWSSVFFEHYVAADVDFGRRPFFDETQGSVIITVDPALGTRPLAATITIPSGSVTWIYSAFSVIRFANTAVLVRVLHRLRHTHTHTPSGAPPPSCLTTRYCTK